MKRKVLILEKDLVKAMSYEKQISELEATVVGIATDYVTAMLLVKDHGPDVIFCNPNLTLDEEGLDVVSYVKEISDCEIHVFQDGLMESTKEKLQGDQSIKFLNKLTKEGFEAALNAEALV